MHAALRIALVATLAVPAAAEDFPSPAPGATSRVTESAVDPAEGRARNGVDVEEIAGALGLGPVNAALHHADILYLALRSGGVAVVVLGDGAPAQRGIILAGQAVSRLAIVDGQLIAFVLSESVVRFDLSDPRVPAATLPIVSSPSLPPRAPPPPPAPPPSADTAGPRRGVDDLRPAPLARVVDVVEGRVVIEVVRGQRAFEKGARVRVVAQRLVEKPDLKTGGTARVPSNEITAVVSLEERDGDRAMAILGRGDVAQIGDLVEPTELPLSESLFLPRRAPFHWRAGFVVRPFLGIAVPGSFPIGAIADGYVNYTFDDVPVAVFAEASPVGTAVLSRDAHFPLVLAVGATYVTDFVEIGLGGGALVGNQGPCFFDVTQIDTDGDGIADQFRDVQICEQNTGATFNQVLRLGALDGVHLKWSSSIFARDTGFVFGVGRAELAIPVSSRFGLFGGGGAGENGWGYGEVGVRTFLGGNGAPGTVMLQTSLGGASIFDGPNRETVGGPSVSFGLEWRL